MVVGTVVVVPVVPAALGAAPVGVGAAIATVVQAPAICMVATSATMRVRERCTAALSDASLKVACVTALAASSRRDSDAWTAADATFSAAIKSFAVMPRYCWAITPSASCALCGLTPTPRLASEVLEYRPLLTYSSMAKRRRARAAVSAWARAADTCDCSAASCSLRAAMTPWSAMTAATASW